MTGWVDDVLDFWFGLEPASWWSADDRLDETIRERFEPLWEELRALPATAFLGSPSEALAAVVLFDQFPRNMFRGHADQFSTDSLALKVAGLGVDRGLDERLTDRQRGMFYMPFQHSEALDDQKRALLLFASLGEPRLMEFAQKHHDVIARFGRFPHRNTMLGRSPRADEIAAGDVTPF